MLDYDDLLLYWHAPAGRSRRPARPSAGSSIACWSTSIRTPTRLQAEILYQLSPEGKGLTVVGDDAQSIYSFRAATVRNILDFPQALSRHDDRHAGAELPQHAADPGGHQPRDRPGARSAMRRTSGRSAPRGSGRRWSLARTRTSRPTS